MESNKMKDFKGKDKYYEGFTKQERRLFESLDSPKKIQLFLNKIPINFDYKKDTCISPKMVLRKNKAHCIEGALFAAVALRLHGYKPLIVDMESNRNDFDHVIAVFKKHGCWGAIAKTNHATLRYRDPVYKNIRELIMSYFHEYIDKKGRKNLRTFSAPIDLRKFDYKGWMTSDEDVWYIPEFLTKVKHYKIATKKQVHDLKKADKIEMLAGELTEWSYGKRGPNKYVIKKS